MHTNGQAQQSNPTTDQALRSRIAPTPSGYLHTGNGFNFVLTHLYTRRAGGLLKLRIYDADIGRSRPEFIEDIFRQLEWLGIEWDLGPSGPEDFVKNHSQQQRFDLYAAVLQKLQHGGHVYPCSCSRKEIRKVAPGGVYPGLCRKQYASLSQHQAIRLVVPQESVVSVNGTRVALCKSMGDFVLWRKDGLPSYQLASLCDDVEDRINCIVRGQDLIDSSAAQLFLADQLGTRTFPGADFIHHPLVTGNDGSKLSKSLGSLSLQTIREQGGGPEQVYRLVAGYLGFDAACISTLGELEQLFLHTDSGEKKRAAKPPFSPSATLGCLS
jgi:glutamyl-tRNA synthetase